MRSPLIRTTLCVQGIFYIVTALWALFALESFLWVMGYSADPFKTHVNAVLFLAIGIWLLLSAFWQGPVRPAIVFGGAIGLGLAAVDFAYLPRIGNPFGAWLDFIAEALFAIVYFFEWVTLKARRHESQSTAP